MGVVLVVGKFQANRVVVHVDRKVVLTKVGRWSQTDTDFDAVAGHGEEGFAATETKVEEGWVVEGCFGRDGGRHTVALAVDVTLFWL